MLELFKRLLGIKPPQAPVQVQNVKIDPEFSKAYGRAFEELNRQVLSRIAHNNPYNSLAELVVNCGDILRKHDILVEGWVQGERPKNLLIFQQFSTADTIAKDSEIVNPASTFIIGLTQVPGTAWKVGIVTWILE